VYLHKRQKQNNPHWLQQSLIVLNRSKSQNLLHCIHIHHHLLQLEHHLYKLWEKYHLETKHIMTLYIVWINIIMFNRNRLVPFTYALATPIWLSVYEHVVYFCRSLLVLAAVYGGHVNDGIPFCNFLCIMISLLTT